MQLCSRVSSARAGGSPWFSPQGLAPRSYSGNPGASAAGWHQELVKQQVVLAHGEQLEGRGSVRFLSHQPVVLHHASGAEPVIEMQSERVLEILVSQEFQVSLITNMLRGQSTLLCCNR